jgi:hypothetical protein
MLSVGVLAPFLRFFEHGSVEAGEQVSTGGTLWGRKGAEVLLHLLAWCIHQPPFLPFACLLFQKSSETLLFVSVCTFFF